MAKDTIKSFSDIQGLSVSIPSLGKTVGVVEDLYFKPGTNAIDALKVRTRLYGYKAVPVKAILAVSSDLVTIVNEQAMLNAQPPFPLVSELRTNKVVNEKGNEVGTVGEVLLSVEPTDSMRIAGFELRGTSNGHARTMSAAAVGHYRPNTIIVDR